MKHLKIMLVAAAMVLPGAAFADSMPATTLVDACNRTDEASSAVCSAYFMGVLDGFAMTKRATDISRPVCVRGLTTAQLKAEFLTYANAHKPSDRTDAQAVVMSVLFDEHTCPQHGT